MVHRLSLLALALCLHPTLLVNAGLAQSTKSAQPDVILIVADDLGWGDLGCYGAKDLRTPAIDSLAATGMRWKNFYANCCVCSPTRASILSGCYPDRVGVPGVIRTHPNNSWGKFADVPTLPKVLASAGYQSACVGKWHLGLETGDHPLDRGFDHFRGFLGDMMDDYYDHRRHDINYMQAGRETIDPEGHATTLFTDWAIELTDLMAQDERPYFLYLAFNAPHTPIQPPPAALDAVRKRHPEMSEERAKLVALIEDMDAGIGRLLKQTEARQRDTLIAFVSDNGGQTDVGANNGGLRDGKQSNYEGGLRIPAIVQWKGHIPAGSETNALGVTMDLMPTLCELVGATPANKIDGVSLAPWLRDPLASQTKREIYFVRREGGTRYCGLTIEALRQGDWKLVHNFPTQAFELFNLATDPLEQVDLAKTKQPKLREMMSALMLHIQRGGAVPWQAAASD
jgi:arylsulfatase A-like enzyme